MDSDKKDGEGQKVNADNKERREEEMALKEGREGGRRQNGRRTRGPF
jgi:hypothetical protein